MSRSAAWLSRTVGRRAVLKGLAIAAPSAWLMARAPLAFAEGEIRILDLANTHTGEQLVADYFRAGEYCQPTLGKLDHVCRDHRTGDVHPLDRPLRRRAC